MEKRKFKEPESFEESVELSMKGYANNLRKIRKLLEVQVGIRTKESYIEEECKWENLGQSGLAPGIYNRQSTGELEKEKVVLPKSQLYVKDEEGIEEELPF